MPQIVFHGTGAGAPSGDRSASALSVRFDDGTILLLDAGEGCSRGVLRDGLALEEIRTVAISHMHPDHWAGLPNLIVGWAMGERESDVNLYLPPGSIDFFKTVLRNSYVFPERLSFGLGFHDLQEIDLPDGWRLRSFRTSHLDKYEEEAKRLGLAFPAYGYALETNDRKIVFSQDVGSEDDLIAEISGAELVVCEMSHIDPDRLISLAQDAGVGHVIFTHIDPIVRSMPERSESVNWSMVVDGTILTL